MSTSQVPAGRLIRDPAPEGALKQRLGLRECVGADVSIECSEVFFTEEGPTQRAVILRGVHCARIEFVELLAHLPDEAVEGLWIHQLGRWHTAVHYFVRQHWTQAFDKCRQVSRNDPILLNELQRQNRELRELRALVG